MKNSVSTYILVLVCFAFMACSNKKTAKTEAPPPPPAEQDFGTLMGYDQLQHMTPEDFLKSLRCDSCTSPHGSFVFRNTAPKGWVKESDIPKLIKYLDDILKRHLR